MKKHLLASALVAAAACALFAQTPPEGGPAAQAAPEIKVEKIAACAGVSGREPSGEASSFDASAGRVYVWTRIAAEKPPVKIKHVYYLDGVRQAEVELAVNGSPYRVWSSKAVRPGSWKVEVTDEAGAVLSTVEFTVTAAGAKPETPAEQAPAGR